MTYLNDLFRSRAEKAGITYVDVWDGFVDEGGRFAQQGPDFEGQTRRLRTSDGLHFTKAGARKLAHYVEREIRRTMNRAGVPVVSLPVEPASPGPQERDPKSPSGGPAATPRPLTGPVVPLTAAPSTGEQLLGGAGARPTAVSPVANRILVRGTAVAVPAGRADDFTWPRRGVMAFGGDPVVAMTTDPVFVPPVAQPAQLAVPTPAVAVARPASREPAGALPAAVRRQTAQTRAPREPERRASPFSFFFPFFR
jgi:hypothetical protein